MFTITPSPARGNGPETGHGAEPSKRGDVGLKPPRISGTLAPSGLGGGQGLKA